MLELKVRDMSRFPYIGWRPVQGYETDEWVKMRSGAGESSYWHRHEGEEDFCGNPVDDGTCRTCGKNMQPTEVPQ